MFALFLVSVTCLAAILSTSTAVEVTQYGGPKECDLRTAPGMKLIMHYTGTIDASSKAGEPGFEFDSSRKRGKTFDFDLGQGTVIRGWEEGLVGLCKGAKVTLIIPPEEGYGDAGAGPSIPGGATLNFDVEVMDMEEAPPLPNLFSDIDTDKDGKLSKDEIDQFFKSEGRETPEGLWAAEDKDGSGFISWEEFSGPKGDTPPEQDL